jgi:hypothetical protein
MRDEALADEARSPRDHDAHPDIMMPIWWSARKSGYSGPMRHVACALALAILSACRPSNVAEAEAKGDVAWLDANGTAEAVAAMGRLADTNPKAESALKQRASFDVNAYIAAWVAAKRGQAWGGTLLRAALADPSRAEQAASAMPRRDPQLAAFVVDIEGAMSRLAAGSPGVSLGGLLASVGPAARSAVERRLRDGASRGAMCSGIGAPDASADARSVLLSVPAEARDHTACVNAIVAMSGADDGVITWLSSSAEPGLLSSVAKSADVACPRVHTIWEKALAVRAPGDYPGLTVPLNLSIKRCTDAMDGVLSDGLTRIPSVRATIVHAIDPYAGETRQLKMTCKALGRVAGATDSGLIRERANDALQHGCRGLP